MAGRSTRRRRVHRARCGASPATRAGTSGRRVATGSVWFGGNHGVALWEARSSTVFEHQHAAINACFPDGHCTLLSGDWFGITLDGNGDLWMGGGHRLAKLQYSTPGKFWSPVSP